VCNDDVLVGLCCLATTNLLHNNIMLKMSYNFGILWMDTPLRDPVQSATAGPDDGTVPVDCDSLGGVILFSLQ